MGTGDPTKCVYQLIYDINDFDDTRIIQYFIINKLGLCIKVDSYVAHMFYSWSFNNNTLITICINKNKYNILLDAKSTVFAWGYGNSNKVRK